MAGAQIAIRVSRLAATLILCRCLNAEDYGLAAIVLTAYEFVALFTRNGISAKVVQASPQELASIAQTAYQMTWLVCAALAALQVLIAFAVAWYYCDVRLAAPIALMGLIYFATPVSNIQTAFQQREGRLGRIAFATGAQAIVDNALTALLALWGFGIWAIVLPKILVAPIWVVCLRYGHAWRPTGFQWSAKGFVGWREIAHFSKSVVGVELMTTFQANIDNLMVGAFLGVKALGLYYFAFNAGLGPMLGLVTAFGAAIYPHLCEVRDDRAALMQRYHKAQVHLSFFILPLTLLQTLLAPFYVPVVFGEKWSAATPVLMIICLSALARPYATLCSQLMKALGRPDIELKWQSGLSLILTLAVLVAAQFNVLAVALVVLVVQSAILTAYFLYAPRSALASIAGSAAASATALRPQFEIVSDPAVFASLQAEWDSLWARADNPHISQTFDWCSAGWRSTGAPRGRELHIVIGRVDGRLVLIWPMTTRRCFAWRLAGPLGSESTEYDPLLVAPGSRNAELITAAHDFVRRSGGVDVVTVPFIAPDSERLPAFSHSPSWHKAETIHASFLDIRKAGDWKGYWMSRSSKLRTNINRRRRYLHKRGDVKVEFVSESAKFEAALDWMLRMKRDWQERKKATNEFIQEEAFRNFLTAFGATAIESGHAAVMTMTLNGRIIAAKFGTIDPARFEGFITTFDPHFEEYSPGVLLQVECLQWCFETGRDYDFRIGDESYKRNWANNARTLTTITAACGVWGAAFLTLQSIAQGLRTARGRLRETIPAGLRRYLKQSLRLPISRPILLKNRNLELV